MFSYWVSYVSRLNIVYFTKEICLFLKELAATRSRKLPVIHHYWFTYPWTRNSCLLLYVFFFHNQINRMQPYSNSLLSTACQVNQAHSRPLAKANTENYEELFGVLLKNVEICRRNSESCSSHVLPGIRKVNTKPLREPLVTQKPWKMAI